MDFLSIRKKARERADAREAARPLAVPVEEPAPAPAPAPASTPAPEPATTAAPSPFVERRRVRRPDPVLTEAELLEGGLQSRFQGLYPSPDGRFATWRPGSGPPPIEPDHRSYDTPRHNSTEPAQELEPAPEPLREPAADRPPPPGSEPERALPRAPTPTDPLDLFFYRPDEEATVVATLGGGAIEEAILRTPEILDEFLTFLVGEEEYAVPIERVREVLRAPTITEVPRAPAHVLGVVTVRGEVVAVIDTRGRLGLGRGESLGGRIVIVDAGDGPLGLLVDAVTSVVRLRRGSIESCPQGISSGASDCVTGIGRYRDRLFMVIEAAALLPRARPRNGGH